MRRLLFCVGVFCIALVSLALISFSKDIFLQHEGKDPAAFSLPSSIDLCYNGGSNYTLPPLVLPETTDERSIDYIISGATIRTGTGNDASGLFHPGLNT